MECLTHGAAHVDVLISLCYTSKAGAAGTSFIFIFLPKTILTFKCLGGSWNTGHTSDFMMLQQHKTILSINIFVLENTKQWGQTCMGRHKKEVIQTKAELRPLLVSCLPPTPLFYLIRC